MYKTATSLFLVCETPLHAGSGDSLGVVDLPIQRERHTSFPKIEGSSLKGALRQAFEDLSVPVQSDPEKKYKLIVNASGKKLREACIRLDAEWKKKEKDEKGVEKEVNQTDKKGNVLTRYQEAIALTFGPEEAGGDGHAGALGFSDARLLLFPVKSMKGVFGWVTCPKVLQQFYRDMSLTELKDGEAIAHSLTLNALTTPKKPEEVSGGCSLFLKSDSNEIVLEEYTFGIEYNEDEGLAVLLDFLAKKVFPKPEEDQLDIYEYWRKKLKTDVVVLTNEDFTDFVNLSTEVITRTKIDNETGTVAQGQLFTEEYLPAESIMYSLVLASPIFKENDAEKGIFSMSEDNPCFTGCENEESKVMKFFETALPEVIQVGGNATLGKGLVRTRVFYESSVTENGGAEDAPE